MSKLKHISWIAADWGTSNLRARKLDVPQSAAIQEICFNLLIQ